MATQALEPVDVEALLVDDLAASGVDAFAPPAPLDLASRVPCAMVERTGGSRLNDVMDAHDVTVQAWGETWAEATALGNRVAGALARLPHETGRSTQWRRANVTALPYAAPDPDQPEIPRVQLSATLCCRAVS